jgi:hypothetical protein
MASAPRPRDRLGRPLPADSPGAFAGVPDRAEIDTVTALAEAATYLRDDLPFHAHEVFEQRWRCAPATERPLWRALAQWAAGLTHAARGNATGARALLVRSAASLATEAPVVDRWGRVLDVGAMAATAAADAEHDPEHPHAELRWRPAP